MPRHFGNVPKSSYRPFEQNLKGIGNSLGNAKIGLETFSAMLKEYQRHLGNCPIKSGDLMGAFPRKQENHLGLMPTVSP
jgi:hypothetical protein